MQTTTHTFRQRATTPDTLAWPDDPDRIDPADDPAWAVWTTDCGSYRVVYDGQTQQYSPQVASTTKDGDRTSTEWCKVGPDRLFLEAAQGDCGVHRA